MTQKIYINKTDFEELSKILIGLFLFIGMPLYIINGVNFNDPFQRYFSLGIAFVFYLIAFIVFSRFKIPTKKVYLKNAKVEK